MSMEVATNICTVCGEPMPEDIGVDLILTAVLVALVLLVVVMIVLAVLGYEPPKSTQSG